MTKLFIACIAIIASFTHTAVAADRVLISGAGATFPAPLYMKWFQDFNAANPGTEINYQAIGSGGGIKQLTAKTVDFGASDAPMSDEELKAAGDVLHIPTVLGAVAVTYNLSGVNSSIQLDQAAVADLFLGKIAKWNDPRLAKLNPGVKFPNQDIVVVYRSDSSGTTAVFTEYLAKVSESWKSTVGSGKTVKWPTGLGGKGNDGVTGQVKNTPGAIGYVELTYAHGEKLPTASIKNKAGSFVVPTVAAVSAAAGALKVMPADFRVSITDADGKGSYPISAFTYLLVPKKMDQIKGTEFVKFLNWAMDQGQKQAPSLSYGALPASLITKVKTSIKSIETK